MSRVQEFYHGTTAHLNPGDVVVPGKEIDKRNFGGARGASNEHVYVTTDSITAFDWGVQGKGRKPKSSVHVYVVKPHTDPEPVPDHPNHGLRTSRATVVREDKP